MNPRTKIVLNILGGVVLAAIAVAFGLNPILANVRSLNGELTQEQRELDKINKQILEFKSAQTDLAKATYKQDVYSTVVVREDLSAAITQLEAAALITNVTESIQILETEKAPVRDRDRERSVEEIGLFRDLTLSDEVKYTMSVKGEFANFVNFIQYLENLPQFTEFRTISLNAVVENLPGNGGSRNSGGITGILEGVFLVKKNAQK